MYVMYVCVAPVVAAICVLSWPAQLCNLNFNSSETFFNARRPLVNLFHSQITSSAVHRIYLCSQCGLLVHISRENVRAHVHLPL